MWQLLRELLQHAEDLRKQLDALGSQIGDLLAKAESALDGIDNLKSDFVKEHKRRELNTFGSNCGGHRPMFPGARRHTPGEIPRSHCRPFPRMDKEEIRAEENQKRVQEEREKSKAAGQDRRKRRPDNHALTSAS